MTLPCSEASATPTHESAKKNAITLVEKADPARPAQITAWHGNAVRLPRSRTAVRVSGTDDRPFSTSAGSATQASHNVVVARSFADGLQLAAVSPDRTSLDEIRYEFDDGFLEMLSDGSVILRESEVGKPVALIDRPWAQDATGRRLPTRYRLHSSRTLVQEVAADDDVRYPVVSDPRIRETWYGASIDFSKSETAMLLGGTGACGVLVPEPRLKAGCLAAAAWAGAATSAGQCVSVKTFRPPGPNVPVPWIAPCYK